MFKESLIENDDRPYPLKDQLKDYLEINKEINAPNVFDILHHECLNNNETIQKELAILEILENVTLDGNAIIVYSSQSIGDGKGKHAKTIEKNHLIFYYGDLKRFFCNEQIEFDIML